MTLWGSKKVKKNLMDFNGFSIFGVEQLSLSIHNFEFYISQTVFDFYKNIHLYIIISPMIWCGHGVMAQLSTWLASFHISWLHTIWVSVMDLLIQLVTLCLFFCLRWFLLGKRLSIPFQLYFLMVDTRIFQQACYSSDCVTYFIIYDAVYEGLFCSIFNDLDQFGALVVNRQLFHCSKKTGF